MKFMNKLGKGLSSKQQSNSNNSSHAPGDADEDRQLHGSGREQPQATSNAGLGGKLGGFMRKSKSDKGGSNQEKGGNDKQLAAAMEGVQVAKDGKEEAAAAPLDVPARSSKPRRPRRAVRGDDDNDPASALAGGDAAYVPPVVPKPPAARRLIFGAVRRNVLFKACSSDELRDLLDAFAPVRRRAGAVVIREGDRGDGFYVCAGGGPLSVHEATAFRGTLGPGTGFGEIALLYSCPRTATVTAQGDVDLWVLDRRAFRAIVARHKRKRMIVKLALLEKVTFGEKTLGEVLKPHELQSVAMATKVKEFAEGQVIVRQGDVGDAFYMIEQGAVDVYVPKVSDSRPVVTLQAGAFFGEKALLGSDDIRTATCVAAETGDGPGVKCLMLMREDFQRMLGDLGSLMERSYGDRVDAAPARGKVAGSEEVHPTGLEFIKDEFDIKRTLGVGAYGFVKLVRWNRAPPSQNDFYYALKCVSKEQIKEKKQETKIQREEDIMVSLVHPFVARCYNVMEDIKGKYFLMEALCGGELCELLYFESKFPEDWSMFYAASVLAAFAHMHERKVAYRDLKPENLVLDADGFVKVVDFGLAKVIDRGQTYTFCGTPDYLAPEVILSEGHDWAVDYWGLGVLIYEMTEGVAPFYADNPMETYRKALSGQVPMPEGFPQVCAGLVRRLLHTDQSKRLGRTVGGATAIMCHRWFADFDWDALLDCTMEVPYVPEEKDPDAAAAADVEGDTVGFATDFL